MRIRRRDFSIWNEKELRSAVNFFELWMQCGMSFFRYLEVYKKIQSVGKKQKQWAKDTPEDFNYLMSLELNPDTHAFKAHRRLTRPFAPISNPMTQPHWTLIQLPHISPLSADCL